MIAFVQPSNEFDELYIDQIEKAVKKGQRRRFTWFSRKDLNDLVNITFFLHVNLYNFFIQKLKLDY